MVVVTSTYISPFGEFYDKDSIDLAVDAIKALNVDLKTVDAIFTANMMNSKLYNMNQFGSELRSNLNLNIPFLNFSLACASGSFAFYRAVRAVESGEFNNVIVVGVEKMSDFNPKEITEALMGASNFENEYLFGLTFTALFGLIASRYLHEYDLNSDLLDKISVKAHKHAINNPLAQFHKDLTDKDFVASPMVSDPLKLLHCSPFTDGASAVLLSNSGNGVEVKDIQFEQDEISLKDRNTLVSFASTKIAAEKLFKRNNLTVKDIDFFEIHDCFAIAEAILYEDLGLSQRGMGIYDAGNDLYRVNLSGGLKACGHPVGATGIKQIAYLVNELNKANSGIALAQNMAGTGNTSILTLLSK